MFTYMSSSHLPPAQAHESFFRRQVVPLVLTVVVCALLIALLWTEVLALNHVMTHPIVTDIRWVDVAIGLTIYLKTSIDFVIFMGGLMSRNRGWKSRIAIEIGTALGNAVGTLAILAVWTFFKDIRWLLGLMVLLAALVLFKMAEESLEHLKDDPHTSTGIKSLGRWIERGLHPLNRLTSPLLRYIIPHTNGSKTDSLPFWALFGMSFTIPFILGLDGFAGYVPLFSVVNVLGFGTGVFLGHMILNIVLYLSPTHTAQIMKNSIISFVGSCAFVGLAVWGLVETFRIFFG